MPGYLICTRFFKNSIRKIVCRAVYIFLFELLAGCYIPSLAQRAKIDSLRHILPSLKDSARADCLNTLSLVYSYLNIDTALSYAQIAFAEASAIDYLNGKAEALNNHARIAGHGFHDFLLQEKLSLMSIAVCRNKKDIKVLEEAYMNLALAYFCQNNFERSAGICNTLMELCKNTGDKKGVAEANAVLGSINLETGNYEKSFDDFNESLTIFKSINDSYNTSILLAKVGDLYRLAGDEKTALNLYFQSLQYPKGATLTWHPLVDLGDTYFSLEPSDSSSYSQEKYIQTIKSLTVRSNYLNYQNIRTAEMHIAYKEYDKALTLLTFELQASKKRKDENQLMRLLLDIARAYNGKKNYGKAFSYTRELLQNSQQQKAKQYTRDGYKLMYMFYDKLRQTDSAYLYYRNYTSMKDSVALDGFSKRLAIYKAAKENEKKQAQIELLDKEKLINEQQLELSAEHLKRELYIKNLLTGSVFVLLLMGFIIFRNIMLKRKNAAHLLEITEKELQMQQLENERTKSEMQHRAVELEMQALRAQMNPHFIFNCLNSINSFIINNNAAKAADHLTKFSKLIRLVLQQSGKPFIPLEDELYCLQLYMDLEALRFEIPFHYEIDTNGINISAVMIPSLLIQPFVENAIWHGLQGKKINDGKINIDINLQGDVLHCKVIDNGVGRIKEAVVDGKNGTGKKSLGIQLTRHRLQFMEDSRRENIGITIHDLTTESGDSKGTCVEIKIPVKEV
jgi:Histidine kinase/Tetratricopeptide repeat